MTTGTLLDTHTLPTYANYVNTSGKAAGNASGFEPYKNSLYFFFGESYMITL